MYFCGLSRNNHSAPKKMKYIGKTSVNVTVLKGDKNLNTRSSLTQLQYSIKVTVMALWTYILLFLCYKGKKGWCENKVLSAISPLNCLDLEGTLIALFLCSFFSKIGTSELPFYRSIQHHRSARKRELYFPLELGRLMTNDNG